MTVVKKRDNLTYKFIPQDSQTQLQQRYGSAEIFLKPKPLLKLSKINRSQIAHSFFDSGSKRRYKMGGKKMAEDTSFLSKKLTSKLFKKSEKFHG